MMGVYVYPALFHQEENGRAVPPTSPLGDVRAEPDQFVSLVDVDMLEHRRKYDNRSVTIAVTVPRGWTPWLRPTVSTYHRPSRPHSKKGSD